MNGIAILGIGKIGKEYIDECLARGITDLKLIDSEKNIVGKYLSRNRDK